MYLASTVEVVHELDDYLEIMRFLSCFFPDADAAAREPHISVLTTLVYVDTYYRIQQPNFMDAVQAHAPLDCDGPGN